MPTNDNSEVVITTNATNATKATRGRGGKNNFPQTAVAEIDSNDVSKALKEIMHANKQPRVKSDDELLDRTSQYFQLCIERGSYPVIEEYALYCGYTLDGLWNIEVGRSRGFSSETSGIIKKAKFCVQALDAKMAQAGKLPFLVYCFRAKNYYGMQDKVEHVVTAGTDEFPSAAQIAANYADYTAEE